MICLSHLGMYSSDNKNNYFQDLHCFNGLKCLGIGIHISNGRVNLMTREGKMLQSYC